MLNTMNLLIKAQDIFDLHWFWDLSETEISNQEIQINFPDSIKTNQQVQGDLGFKMYKAFEEIFIQDSNKKKSVLIIGSDCPFLNLSILEQASKLLLDNDIVLGPSIDGGYYLLGMKELFPSLFEKIDWSTDKVLTQTIRKILDLNKSYSLLPTLADIDTAQDYKNWKTSY